ncbi:MAG: FADH(2)-oxidizing methylenetetrahydrofolate--tRNA-(uracil(54)-C(5))-methyltransferase TrmFO, partial [Rhodospirillaceae bacterium]|nr:FADH(2)-oxidizing methylenetetrahydrofolate--tRNA-(uracil(54)-C(5))-methyltransferase TrmFO [Rhodospirillaceae bacterium]
ETFQPMNVNFGLIPPLEDGALADVKRKERKRERRRLMSRRALSDIAVWFSDTPMAAE